MRSILDFLEHSWKSHPFVLMLAVMSLFDHSLLSPLGVALLLILAFGWP